MIDPATWSSPLETARLTLLTAGAEHAEAAADAAVESAAEVSRWSRREAGAGDRADQVRRFLERATATARGTVLHRYSFTRDDERRFVGGVSLRPWVDPRVAGPDPAPSTTRVDASREVEIGTWCRTSMVGHGYASEAAAAVVAHALGAGRVDALWLRTAADNLRARRVAERLGFQTVEEVAYPASPEWGAAATVLIMRMLAP
jgi:RimJ/RimL family protein N-acetyltransferase